MDMSNLNFSIRPRKGLRKLPNNKDETKKQLQFQSFQLLIGVGHTQKFNWRPYLGVTFILCLGILVYIWFYSKATPLLSSSHRNTSNLAFEVVDVFGKGMGAIATRDIQQGELLIRESPLFTVPDSINSSPTALISHHLSLLSPSQRHEFYSLSHIGLTPGMPSPLSAEAVILSIFQTNAIAAGADVGIFPTTARLNHACSKSFNSVYSWRGREQVLVVHALRPIKKGEELLTTYTDTKKPRAVRRHFLEQNYDFTCDCGVCSLPDPLSRASDARLMKMVSQYTRFASWGHGTIDGKEAVVAAKTIWDIGEQEGYWSERGRLAADAAHVAAAHSDEIAAMLWAQVALKWYTVELGGDSEEATGMQRVITNPTSHQAWGTRPFMRVGNPGMSQLRIAAMS